MSLERKMQRQAKGKDKTKRKYKMGGARKVKFAAIHATKFKYKK